MYEKVKKIRKIWSIRFFLKIFFLSTKFSHFLPREFFSPVEFFSTKNIVETANSLIKHNEKQIEKDVWTNNNKVEAILVCETATDNDEGRLVANTINKLLTDRNYKDFAILYRTNAQSRSLEEALRKFNIPYKIYGGISFFNLIIKTF